MLLQYITCYHGVITHYLAVIMRYYNLIMHYSSVMMHYCGAVTYIPQHHNGLLQSNKVLSFSVIMCYHSVITLLRYNNAL